MPTIIGLAKLALHHHTGIPRQLDFATSMKTSEPCLSPDDAGLEFIWRESRINWKGGGSACLRR